MRYPPVSSKTVLITGCSSGIGAATAALLRNHGWTVIPTARKDEDLDRLRSDGFSPVRLDTSADESVRRAAEQALDLSGGHLGALVNNAGFGQPGAVEDLTRDTLRYQFETNLVGMQDLTNRLIPAFRNQGCGRIVNISSVVGRVSLPFFGAYSATKFAMEALSDAMRVELRGTGIAVSLVEPGPIDTRFGPNAADKAEADIDIDGSRFGNAYRDALTRYRDDRPAAVFMKPPEAVAKKIRHALESSRPRTRYKVTIPAYLGAFLSRFAPDWAIDRMMATRWEKRVE
jgi:NAD(P)-dependent dehydrogenase (short-subunit alcohol dehydrogenase family)